MPYLVGVRYKKTEMPILKVSDVTQWYNVGLNFPLWVNRPLYVGQLTRPTQTFILLGFINEYYAEIRWLLSLHWWRYLHSECYEVKAQVWWVCSVTTVWSIPERFEASFSLVALYKSSFLYLLPFYLELRGRRFNCWPFYSHTCASVINCPPCPIRSAASAWALLPSEASFSQSQSGAIQILLP